LKSTESRKPEHVYAEKKRRRRMQANYKRGCGVLHTINTNKVINGVLG